MGIELLFFFLPVAAASGWWMAARKYKRNFEYRENTLSPVYFKGLNYILDDQPDKAADVFLSMVDVNADTIDFHFALATLFLKRGEVDRAIRIHQNLIARPTLSRVQRSQALYHLGYDYLRAGVLDRAEAIFLDLLKDQQVGVRSMYGLLNIYQQEKEWQNAIDIARRLSKRVDEDFNTRIAHYYCELAEPLSLYEFNSTVKAYLKQALSFDKMCARANLIEGTILQRQNKYTAALKVYKRIEKQDVSLLPDVLSNIVACYKLLDKKNDALIYVQNLHSQFPTIFSLFTLSSLYCDLSNSQAAVDLLKLQMINKPSAIVLEQLIKVGYFDAGNPVDNISDIFVMLSSCVDRDEKYRCGNCGFEMYSLHWQCPSCHSWDTVRIINEKI